jgi:UDP-N-acetylmuramyl pentapeptide phosphotransferase/UDP-N-acetylglucosamine-1-phosphate transferase
MIYLAVFALLFLCELLYFKIADKYNIIDKPNHRSAHSQITLRGGGIIFPVALLILLAVQALGYTSTMPHIACFTIGLLAIASISFLDDILDLSSKIRLIFHFLAVSLLIFWWHQSYPLAWWLWPALYIMVIGILNAYNFMDGINGISGLYSLVALGSLYYINQYQFEFISTDFILFPALACVVFLYFNFRKKAKCFMGDVGSMAIAFWLLAILGMLIFKTGEYKYLLLLSIYGIDVVLTIIERIGLKENILKAHARHFYQRLVHVKKWPHLRVSVLYALCQGLLNAIILLTDYPFWAYLLLCILPLSILYLLLKKNIKQ